MVDVEKLRPPWLNDFIIIYHIDRRELSYDNFFSNLKFIKKVLLMRGKGRCKCKQTKNFDNEMEGRIIREIITKDIIKKLNNPEKIVFARWIAGHSIMEIFESGVSGMPSAKEIENILRNTINLIRKELDIEIGWCQL